MKRRSPRLEDPLTYRIAYARIAQELHTWSELDLERDRRGERAIPAARVREALIAVQREVPAPLGPILVDREVESNHRTEEEEGPARQARELVELSREELLRLGYRWVGKRQSRFERLRSRRWKAADKRLAVSSGRSSSRPPSRPTSQRGWRKVEPRPSRRVQARRTKLTGGSASPARRTPTAGSTVTWSGSEPLTHRSATARGTTSRVSSRARHGTASRRSRSPKPTSQKRSGSLSSLSPRRADVAEPRSRAGPGAILRSPVSESWPGKTSRAPQDHPTLVEYRYGDSNPGFRTEKMI